ncbi:MAG: phosphotransferase family protein [Nocardioides sp.]|uniref:phosphotransferase family protein n=1 Tax=Nocardioides sp. TaxID=35761 RepID=UPI003F117460
MLAAFLHPLEGGATGRTFSADLGEGPVVVRIHPPGEAPGPYAPQIQASVHRLVRGLVPVPAVLETRPGRLDRDEPGLLVTQFVAGERGDLALATMAPRERGLLLADLARIAATLAGMPLLAAGRFRDPDLRVEPFEDDLVGYVTRSLGNGGGAWGSWSSDRRARLLSVAEEAQDVLDGVGRVSLVHGDLHPKNVLVDPEAARVLAVVDWEFAHAGHPFSDVGNLLRGAREPEDERAVCEAWTALRGGEPAAVREGGRAADLLALVDLVDRVPDRPEGRRAEALLRAIASTGDLHARPD